MTLLYSSEARDKIRRLAPQIKQDIRAALEALAVSPNDGTPLQRELSGYWTLAVARYRIIYEWDDSRHEIRIHTVGHRRQVYEDFARFVRDR